MRPESQNRPHADHQNPAGHQSAERYQQQHRRPIRPEFSTASMLVGLQRIPPKPLPRGLPGPIENNLPPRPNSLGTGSRHRIPRARTMLASNRPQQPASPTPRPVSAPNRYFADGSPKRSRTCCDRHPLLSLAGTKSSPQRRLLPRLKGKRWRCPTPSDHTPLSGSSATPPIGPVRSPPGKECTACTNPDSPECFAGSPAA